MKRLNVVVVNASQVGLYLHLHVRFDRPPTIAKTVQAQTPSWSRSNHRGVNSSPVG